ncbi:hypothetical protein D9M68_52900 [compost metagenome]|nr:hypothetical protein BSF44_35910 [Pseudomonas sp. ACN8]
MPICFSSSSGSSMIPAPLLVSLRGEAMASCRHKSHSTGRQSRQRPHLCWLRDVKLFGVVFRSMLDHGSRTSTPAGYQRPLASAFSLVSSRCWRLKTRQNRSRHISQPAGQLTHKGCRKLARCAASELGRASMLPVLQAHPCLTSSLLPTLPRRSAKVFCRCCNYSPKKKSSLACLCLTCNHILVGWIQIPFQNLMTPFYFLMVAEG